MGEGRFWIAAALLCVLFLSVSVAACGGDDDDGDTAAQETETQEAAGGPPAATLEVSESDFKIDPKDGKVDEDGLVQFEVTNDGETTHQLSIEAPGEIPRTTDTIEPGEDETFTVELDSGKYTWYCPIGNHRELGMEGTLTVGGGGGSGGAATGEDETETESEGGDDSGGGGAGY
jgi:uncharacterized cupredoxin-like copper-binding protein